MNTSIQKWCGILVVLSISFLLGGCTKGSSNLQSQAVKDSSAASLTDTSAGTPKTLPAMTYEQRQGKFFYDKYCAVCHGTDGKGDGFNAFNLDPKPRDFSNKVYLGALTDARLVETISGGGRSVDKSPVMPSWGGRLNKREIEYLVAYVRTFAE